MKRLFIIGGTMGAGKTAVCRELQSLLPDCVFLDGDWCWDSKPFIVTGSTKALALENIRFLLNGFLRCRDYKNVVFCWVMHRQDIIDSLLSGLDTGGARVRVISLVCAEAELRERLGRDVARGIRQPDVTERSVARIPLYEELDTEKIDVTRITAREAAELILGARALT